jgi:hypothetical protein
MILAMAGFAQGSSPFVSAWLNDGSPLSDADVNTIVSNVGQQQPNPDHILVIVHGLGNSRDDSTSQFNDLAPRLTSEFQKANQKVAVVGLQWNSDVPMGLFTAEGNYLDMVARARKVGHWPARQVMLQLQKQNPKAKIDIFAHSLGCEVTAAFLVPEITYTDDIPKSEAFQPQQDLFANMVTLCGSDLNFDVWAKSGLTARSDKRRMQAVWMTMSPYLGDHVADSTLSLRAIVRGPAAGSCLPLMTEQQYDTVLKNKGLIIDNIDVPTDHAFLHYYNDARVGRLAPMAIYLGDPKQRQPREVAELDMILSMPNQAAALLPYLDSPSLTAQLYALWRLEHINCGSSKHLADQTIETVARLLKNKPATVRSACKESACQTMSKRYWPTEAALIRAGAPDW